MPDRDAIRSWFAALECCEDVLLDNAGGSQVPRCVIEAMAEFMRRSFVQVGADYDTSRRSTRTVDDAHAMMRTLMGGDGVGEVVLGASTTALLVMLSDCVARSAMQGRDEIIVSEANHESNIGPWLRLRDRGFDVRLWRFDRGRMSCSLDALEAMVSERTRLVCVPMVSNILGRVEDIGRIVDVAHAVGARVVVDAVAYAPHRVMDCKALGADFQVLSCYKVYGPHCAAMFGTHEAWGELESANHFFVGRDRIAARFEPGGVSHEACAGLLGLRPYLCFLSGENSFSRASVEGAFAMMRSLEDEVGERLLAWMRTREDIEIVADGGDRVATISFTVRGRSSRRVAQALNAMGLGVRWGHFYSYRLCEAMGLDPHDGVVRASLVHYTSPAEVDRLIEGLERVLAGR